MGHTITAFITANSKTMGGFKAFWMKNDDV
jgi:hypothetical protein